MQAFGCLRGLVALTPRPESLKGQPSHSLTEEQSMLTVSPLVLTHFPQCYVSAPYHVQVI